MSDDVYQGRLLSLAKQSDNGDEIQGAALRSRQSNPMCGDEVVVTAALAGGALEDIRQSTRGCVLCRAAAALMMEITAGNMDRQELAVMCAEILGMFQAESLPSVMDVFLPVVSHPARHGCVLLPFEALADVLEQATCA